MTTDATTAVTPAPTLTSAPVHQADEKALKRIGYVLAAGTGMCGVMAVYTGLAQREACADFNTASTQISRSVQQRAPSAFMTRVSSSQFISA